MKTKNEPNEQRHRLSQLRLVASVTPMVALGAIVAFAGVGYPLKAAAESVSETFRTECRKTSDRGCSANGAGVYQAPSGYYIEADSISEGQVVNYWKKQPRCYAPKLDGRVAVPFPGTTAVATFFTSFNAPMHVESGSGGGNLGQVAFVNCRYSFRINELPN